jgi:pimeloyl-ACP methyl ester carboxylesterase
MSGASRGFTTASSLRRAALGLAIATLTLTAAVQAANAQAATLPSLLSESKAAPHASLQHAPAPGTGATSRPHVYLMRGLLNIFSLGMDQLATEIESHGIDANVYNHTVADSVIAQIAAKYHAGDHGPYILVGHSLGADAVMMMAQSLNAQNVPVALVIPFDGTGSYAASKNVGCVLNMTQREYAYMRPGIGFRGKLQNVDVSADPGIDHFTIDKSPRLQGMALNSILQTVHGEACRPAAVSPAVASPKAAPAPKVAAPGEAKPSETSKQSIEIPASTQPATHGIEG